MRNNNKHAKYMNIIMEKRIAQYMIHPQSTLNKNSTQFWVGVDFLRELTMGVRVYTWSVEMKQLKYTSNQVGFANYFYKLYYQWSTREMKLEIN